MFSSQYGYALVVVAGPCDIFVVEDEDVVEILVVVVIFVVVEVFDTVDVDVVVAFTEDEVEVLEVEEVLEVVDVVKLVEEVVTALAKRPKGNGLAATEVAPRKTERKKRRRISLTQRNCYLP